jgi:hypothetical protein
MSEHFNQKFNSRQFVPPGHYYSPIPDLDEVQKYRNRLFDRIQSTVDEVDLQADQQLKMLDQMEQFYKEIPFATQKTLPYRYFYNNPSFAYGDAITLYSMLRIIKPHKYIEVGSGYSSCAALDTDEFFLSGNTNFSFIEPDPVLLYSLIKDEDRRKVNILTLKLQDVDVNFFAQLDSGDILFFDTSHVCKTGSDVQYIFFDILPVLKSGVYIHFHDTFFPFEYPEEWIMGGKAWNELYVLHAFLQNNSKYKIVYFNNYMGKIHNNLVGSKLPAALINIGGSIWLKKN